MRLMSSIQLMENAQQLIPGGVNSPVRACRSVGSDPLFIREALGSIIFDVDGNRYIDYVCSWGPMILGHRFPAVIQNIVEVLDHGTSYGAPTELEIELAQMVVNAVPSVEMVRMVNSGTEATMSAIRLARGATGRDLILKFDGCYHGHADSLLVAAGSGVATLAIAGSAGVPQSFVDLTLSIPYNDIDIFNRVMQEKGDSIAAVIVEPVAANMGLVLPKDGFLQQLRTQCSKYGSLLIFDEVITGFRLAYGGAQERFGIRPDLSCFGKIIGGGLPVGAYGGRKDIMEKIAPTGPVYQAGTLSGNPLAMAAGIATLKAIGVPGYYDRLEEATAYLFTGILQAANNAGVLISGAQIASLIGVFFTPDPVSNMEEAQKSDLDLFSTYYKGMLEEGIYIAPSQFESMFVSSAHTQDDLDQTIKAAEKVFSGLAPKR